MQRLAVDGGVPVRTAPFPNWPMFGAEEERLILEVVRSGKWGGNVKLKLQELEDRFAKYHEARHAVSVVNGTLAITIALQAAGVAPGDEVIMPAYTFVATASAALLFGAIPVFVDIDEDSLLLDPEKIEALISPRTKAIVTVHIAGAPSNMTRLRELAQKYHLRLIEDAAQAVGARWNGRSIGALGDLGTFSFQSGKNITSGEGGMILTNDDKLAEMAWSLANVGRVRHGGWYQHEHVGWNLRMTEFQAAILLAQMTRMEEQFDRREQNARRLDQLLSPISGVRTVASDPRIDRHAYHLYMFRIEPALADHIDKQDVVAKLNAEGIPVQAGYVALNRNQAIVEEVQKWTGTVRLNACPVSERMAEKEALWLGQNVLLGDDRDMDDIAQAVRKVFGSL